MSEHSSSIPTSAWHGRRWLVPLTRSIALPPFGAGANVLLHQVRRRAWATSSAARIKRVLAAPFSLASSARDQQAGRAASWPGLARTQTDE